MAPSYSPKKEQHAPNHQQTDGLLDYDQDPASTNEMGGSMNHNTTKGRNIFGGFPRPLNLLQKNTAGAVLEKVGDVRDKQQALKNPPLKGASRMESDTAKTLPTQNNPRKTPYTTMECASEINIDTCATNSRTPHVAKTKDQRTHAKANEAYHRQYAVRPMKTE